MIRRPRPPLLLSMLVALTVLLNLRLVWDETWSDLQFAESAMGYARLVGLSILMLLPSFAGWMLLLWKAQRTRFYQASALLRGKIEPRPSDSETQIARVLTGVGISCMLLACSASYWRLAHTRGALEFAPTPVTTVHVGLGILSAGILLVAASRFALLRGRNRGLRTEFLETQLRLVEQCDEACRNVQDARARTSQAREGQAALQLVALLDPNSFELARERDASFEAVVRCADLAEALFHLNPTSPSQSAAHRRERVRELLAVQALTNEELARARVPVPGAPGQLLSLAQLHDLLDTRDAAKPELSEPAVEPQPPEELAETLEPEPAASVPDSVGPARWVGVGEPVRVQGFVLEGGLFYLGDGLRAVHSVELAEPALIDPALRLDPTSPARSGRDVPARPSYSELNPKQRAAYLEWLSAGRDAPGAYVGYVLLFLYGLERRVGYDRELDQDSRPEWLAIRDEILRLNEIYGELAAFGEPAHSLLRWMDLQLEDLGENRRSQLELELALGHLAAQAQPVPAELALAWLLASARFEGRISAKCGRAEFAELFEQRYSEAHGSGLVLDADAARLECTHSPASPSFASALRYVSELPDPARDERFHTEIAELLESCSADLSDS